MIRHSQCGCGPGKTPCGCCAGIEALTPLLVTNRPGRSGLAYRVGTQATFLETMLARLATLCLGSEDECRAGAGLRPLLNLSTRDPGDPSIALLDAWATVADVLTFYQERIANEGYLRTATERRSIIELARLVGYRLRPGVAASVYLALTIEKNEKVVIEPFQVRAQSVPGPGELPQSFENVEELEARGSWNKLVPRQTQPLNLNRLAAAARENRTPKLYLKGATTGLNQGDPLLISVGASATLLRVIEVNADSAADRTQVVVMPWLGTRIPRTKARDAVKAIVTGFDNPGAAAAHLKTLSDELTAGRSDADLADFIERDTLPGLARVTARRNISKAFRDRVRVLSEDLEGTLTLLQESGASATVGTTLGETANLPEAHTKAAEDRMLRAVMDGLTREASAPPRNQLRLGRDPASAFRLHSDLGIQAVGVFQPALLDSLPVAVGNTPATHPTLPEVYAFRVKSAPFGHNAPLRAESNQTTTRGDNGENSEFTSNTKISFNEWTADDVRLVEEFFRPAGAGDDKPELSNVLYLDGNYEKILPDSWVVVETGAIDITRTPVLTPAHPPVLISQAAKAAANISRAAYGLSGNTTRIELAVDSNIREEAAWLRRFPSAATAAPAGDDFQVIRRTVVYAQSELLPLSEEPIEEDICTTEKNRGWIVLDGLYSELKSGRWVMIEGERADMHDAFDKPISGVKGIELAMLAEVVHDYDPDIPGDTAHTRIKLAADLEYCYARNQVTLYANVVRATHGETRQETLGSGDGSKALQKFGLKQSPLTYVSAPTPSGVESTLKVFVNDIEWHEAESIFGLEPTARRFVTTRSDAEVTTLTFGNGKQGARPPTGLENVRAKYRQGLGKAGNVAERQITLLAARPLSVKDVINPRRASGGADPETRDQARRNAPLAVLALDRLVSTSDYADLARTFGGVGKAFSVRLSDGIRELVHVTIAGAADVPIAADSDVLRNLRLALSQFGDPALPVNVAVRELRLLVISAGVRLLPNYVWEKVAPQIRAKLLATFSFEARQLGQHVFLSEVISAMQSVGGVAYVDVDAFGGIDERNPDGSVRTPNELIEASQRIVNNKPQQRVAVNLPGFSGTSTNPIRPAQLAYLVPEVPDTLIINLI